MKAVELFVGAGGLAMGTALAGFKHEALIERDRYACDTIRENQRRGLSLVSDWPLFENDVTYFDFAPYEEKTDLLAGGPPCQPFSLGGKHRGQLDPRNMFPQMFRAVRAIKPRAILVENVRGLVRRSFAEYFEYIILQFTYPEITRRDNDKWTDHLSRLERHHTAGRLRGLSYRVVFRVLNAADYGVPQRRHRVFIVGIRSDIGREWSFPDPTHSEEALHFDQWVTGEYWERHRVSRQQRPSPPPSIRSGVTPTMAPMLAADLKPWVTVRDAIFDLPDPRVHRAGVPFANHSFQPGARRYPGHTGSPPDDPAKTLKAGDHGVPGGENMLAYPNGELRYFTVRESARLQTFPDAFRFHGSWTETMRQLGNAVPVHLSEVIARGIRKVLLQGSAEAMR